MAPQPPNDHVDEILGQWASARPDLDVSGMAVLGRLSRLAKTVQVELDQVFATHGLEGWEFDVLATLLRNGPRYQLTAGELLDSMMITSGTMTNRINRLETSGLVRRERNPDDGRQVLVTLTDEGQRVVTAAVADHAANGVRLTAGLSASQQATLITLLKRLDASIRHE